MRRVRTLFKFIIIWVEVEPSLSLSLTTLPRHLLPCSLIQTFLHSNHPSSLTIPPRSLESIPTNHPCWIFADSCFGCRPFGPGFCRPFGPWVLWVLSSFWSLGPMSLSSFWSLGPMDFVVLLVLGSYGFCRPFGPLVLWVCRPFGPWVLWILSSLWSSGWMVVVVLSVLC